MDLIVKFLFLSGKYITCAAGKTILELVNQSVKIHRHVSRKYEQLTQMVGPYDNMLELFNARIEDNPLHYLAVPPCSSCNQGLAPTTYTEVPITLTVPCSYECESEDQLAQDHQHEVANDEYEQIYQDLCEDLHKSSMELQNEMQDNHQATADISQTFIPLYDDGTDEVHDVPSHDTITTFHFIPKKQSPETPKHHHNTIPVHHFFRNRFYSDCSQDGGADVCNLGLVSMCDRYAHMNHLLTDAPDDSYFKKNAFSTQSENPKVDSNTGMYNLRTILLHPLDIVGKGSNEAIENDYKDEITHRTFVIKKNCDDCIDKFRDNVAATALRSPQKHTSQQSRSFDAKLRNKILGIISRNMSSSNFRYDMDLEDICDDLMNRVKQETKLIRINQTAFNKLEQKVTQFLISQSWKDIEKVFARGRRAKNGNTEEIKKLTFDEINSNTSVRIRDAIVASKNKKRTKENGDDKSSSRKFATLEKEEGETTDVLLNSHNKNANVLFTKLKHLETLSKELDSFCSLENIGKIPIMQHDTLKSILLAPLPEIASPMEVVAPLSKTMDQAKMVAVSTDKQSAAKNETTNKTGLTDYDIENMRERSKIIDSNMKAFRIFEDNLKKVVILDKLNDVKGGPKVMKEEELAEDKTASSDKKHMGGKLNEIVLDYKEATKIPSPTFSTKPNNVKKIVLRQYEQPKSDFIVTDRQRQETPILQMREQKYSKIGDSPTEAIIRQSQSDFKRTYGTEKSGKEAIRTKKVNSEEEEHGTDEMECRENIDMLNKELYNNQPDEVDNSVSDLIARLWDKPSTRVSLESSVYVDANTLMFPQSSDPHSNSQPDDCEYPNEDDIERSQQSLQPGFNNRLKKRSASDTGINAGKKKKVLINIYVSNTSVCNKAPVVKAAENLVSVLKTSQSITQLMKKNQSSISNFEDDQIDEKEVSLNTASKQILIDVERVWKVQQSLKPSVNVEKLHVDTDRLSTVQQSLESAVEPVTMEPAACPKIDVEKFYSMQQHLTPTMPTSRAFSVRDSVTTAPLAQKIVDTFDRSTTMHDAAKDSGHFVESMFGQYGHFFQPYLGIYASRRLNDKVKGVMSEHVTSRTKAIVDSSITKQHSMNDFKIDYGLNNKLNSISFKDNLKKERSHYLETGSSNASAFIRKLDNDNNGATTYPIGDTKLDDTSKDLTGGQSNSKGNLRQLPLMAANTWNYNAISSAEIKHQDQESNDEHLEPSKSQHTMKTKNIKLKYDTNSKEISQVVFNADSAGDTDIFDTITENATALLNKFQGSKNNSSNSSNANVSKRSPREENDQSTLRKMFDFLPNENLGFAEPTEEPLVITNKYTKPTEELAISDTEKPLYQRLLAFLPVNKSNNTTCSLQQVRPKSDSGKNDDIDRDIDYIIDKDIEKMSKKRSPNDEEASRRKLRANEKQRTNRYESKANEKQEDTDKVLQDYYKERKRAKLRDLDRDDVPVIRDTQIPRETREYVRMKKTNDSYDDQDTPDEIDPRKTTFSYEKYKEAYRDKIERSKKHDAEIKRPVSNPKLEKRVPEKKAKFGETEESDGDLYKNLQRSLTRKKSKGTNDENKRYEASNDLKLKYYQPKPMPVREQFPKTPLSSKQEKEAKENHSSGRHQNDNFDHRYNRKLANAQDDTPDVYVKEYEPESPPQAKKRPEYHTVAPPKPKPMANGDNHDQNEVYENRKEIRRDRAPRRTNRDYTRADEQQLMDKRPINGTGSSNYQWKPLYPTEQKPESHSDFKPQKHAARPSERILAKDPKSVSQLRAPEEHQKKSYPQTRYSTSNLPDNTEDKQEVIGKEDNKVSIKVDINQPKMKKISFEFKPFNPNHLTQRAKQRVDVADQSKPAVQTNQTSTYKVLIKSNDDGEVAPKVEESYEEFQAQYVSKHSSERSGDDKPDQGAGGHVADDISPGPKAPSQKTPKFEYLHRQHTRNEEPRRHPRAKAPDGAPTDGAPTERQHLEEQQRVEKKSSRRYIEATRERIDTISQYEKKGNKATRDDNSKKASHQSDPEELYRRHSKRNLREMQQVYIKPKQRANDRYQPVRMAENTIPSVLSQAPKVEEQHKIQDRLDVESRKPRKFKMPKQSQEEQAMTQSVPTEEHNEPVQRTEDNLKYRPAEKRKAEDSQEETSTSENMTVSQQINQLSQLIQQQKTKENNETLKSKEYSYQQQEPIKPEPLHQDEIVQENETFMHPIEEEQVVQAPRVKERHQSREVARIASKDHQHPEDERIDERSDYQEEPPIKAFAEESKPHIRVSEDVEPVDNHQPAQKSFEFRPINYKSTKFEPKLDHSVVKTPPKKLVKSFEYNHMESKVDREISQDGADYYKLFHPQISHTPKLTQSQKYYRKMQVAADGMGGNIAPPPSSSVPPFKMPQRPRQIETEDAPEPRQRYVPPIPKPRPVEHNREELHVSNYKTHQQSQEQYQTEKQMRVEDAKVEDSDLSEQPSCQGQKKKPEWKYQAQHEPNTYESFGDVDKSDPTKANALLRAVHEKARKHMEERKLLEEERKIEEERIRALEKPKHEHVASSQTAASDASDASKSKQSRVVYKPGGHLTNTSFKFKPLAMPKNYAEVDEPKLTNPKPRQAALELKKVEKKEHGDIRRVFQFKPVEKLDEFGVDKVLPEVEIAESLNNARLEVSSRSKINKTEEQREALVADKLAKRTTKDQAPQNRTKEMPPSRPNSIQRSKPSIEFIREEKSDDRKLEGRKTEGEANEKKVTQSPYTHKSLRDHQNAYPRQTTDPQPRPPTTPAVSPKENNIGDYVWTNESHNPKHGEARTETSKLKAIITKSIQNTQLRDQQQQQTNVTNKKSEFDRGQYLQYEQLSRSDHRKPSAIQSAFGNARADSPRRPDEPSKTSITARTQMEMSTATAPMKRLEPEQIDEEQPSLQPPPPKPSFVYSFDHQYRGNKSNDTIRKKRFDYWKKLSRIDNWTPVVTDPTIQNELYRPKVILKVQKPEERIAEDQPPLLPEYGPADDHKDEAIKPPVKPKRSMKELKLEQTLDKRLSNVSPLLKHYLKVKAMAQEKSAHDTPVVSVPSISTAIRRNPPNNTILIEMTPQENIYQKYPLLRKGHNQRDMEELARREQEKLESEMKAHAEENLIKLEKIKLAAEMQPSPRRKEPSYLRDTAVKFKADVDKYSNMMKWKMKYMAHVEKLNAPRRIARKSRENLLVKKFPFLKKFRKVNQVTWPREQIEHWDAADYAPVRYDLTAVSRKKPWYSEEDEKSEDESSSKIFYEDRKKYKFKEKEITSKFGKPVKMTYLVDDEEK